MYAYGPTIERATIEWLERGAKFPDFLCVRISDTEEPRKYRILDRNESGLIEALKTGRRGKKGFVLRIQDPATEQEFAAKLCIPADYDESSPLTEVEFASKLRGGDDLILLPRLVGRVDHFADEPQVADPRPWICFISDWLTGVTLEELVRRAPEEISPALVSKIAKELLTAVMFMEVKGLKHDDLTLGNLMLVDGNADLAAINPERGQRSLRIIDLGSVKQFTKATGKADDDWSNIARCLACLHNVLHANRAEASRHPEFLRRIKEFIESLADEDRSRYFPDPGEYFQRLQSAEDTISIEPRTSERFHPLDAISAEHLASDALLLSLFVDHLPWISMVEQKGPVALIGPRGCGKSMVFRYLAARTHIHSQEVAADLLDRTGMFGIYIGCASDLGNDLIWLNKSPNGAEQYVDAIVDYFNLVLVRELMRSLASASRVKALAGNLGITDSGKREVVSFIENALSGSLHIVHVGGMELFQACADGLDRLRLALAKSLRAGDPLNLSTGETFLRDICRLLTTKIHGLATYTITFLLDDYTAHRLSKPIQNILNTVAFQRDASHLFKISSEPYGFDAEHFYGARVDANREYVEIDAGHMTLDMSEHDRRGFVTKLLDKRLEAAQYVGRANTLIGASEYKDDQSLAVAIRSERKGKKTYYNGLHVLGNAWSGDVATILHMVRNMFADAHIGADSNQRIASAIQHDAIVRVSKGLRGRVPGFHPFGGAMSNILSAFGDLAQKLLVDAIARGKDGSTFPHRKYRIEMTLPPSRELENELERIKPGGELVGLYRELVRRAIFHEMTPSRGKEGAGRRTVRIQVRASFLPSFGTSLVRKNHLKIERVEDFVEFLTEPGRWAQSVFNRYKIAGGLFDTLPPEEVEE